jgi:hypothetical protein
MIKRNDSKNARPETEKTPEKRGKTDVCGFRGGRFGEAGTGGLGIDLQCVACGR